MENSPHARRADGRDVGVQHHADKCVRATSLNTVRRNLVGSLRRKLVGHSAPIISGTSHVYKIVYSGFCGRGENDCKSLKTMVGARGLEPRTSCV